jgi:peptidoglycan/xylan/chitin deacetylase (PgdA/CDA1 family)
MGALDLAAVAIRSPLEAWYLVQQRLAPGRLIDRLSRLSKASGVSKPTFLLSFDCDTDRDIALSWDVHARLVDLGVTPVYAVPGEILERGAKKWRRIADSGAEFLNHGYREHTIFQNEKYISTLFYDRMTPAEVEEDIVKGHEAVTRIIGKAPQGFRVPHFGTYSSDDQLRHLHGILSRLGYRFSSSTTPYAALRYGALTRRYGIAELPVSGCVDYPMLILDSYTFRFASNRFGPKDYLEQAGRWSDLLATGRPYFLNLYADPSQVADWPEFFAAIKRLAPYSRSSYGAVLDEFNA